MVNASDLSSNPNSSTGRKMLSTTLNLQKIHSGLLIVNARTLTVIQAEKNVSKTINYESNLSGDSSSNSNSKDHI